MEYKFEVSHLSETGKSIFKLYQDVLKIDEDTAIGIIRTNKTAQTFIANSCFGQLTSSIEYLTLLLSLTLCRKRYDFSPLKPSELDLLKEHYPDVIITLTDGYVPVKEDKIAARDSDSIINYYKNRYPDNDKFIKFIISDLDPAE